MAIRSLARTPDVRFQKVEDVSPRGPGVVASRATSPGSGDHTPPANPSGELHNVLAIANGTHPTHFEGIKKLHFIGIGGVGMSGIAQMCLEQGLQVSGSDMKESETTRRLRSKGARICKGHAADNIQDTEVVIISSAIRAENPELAAAQERGLPVRKRAELLGWLMAGKVGIAVAGAHGKTTTTSLTSWLLEQGGFDPTLIVGGEAVNTKNNVRFGQSPYLVAEADESDASFLLLPARIAIVTNIDDDHLDFYGSFERLVEVFERFINRIDPAGYVVLCTDNVQLRQMLPKVQVPCVTYGLQQPADYSADQIDCGPNSSKFRLLVHGEPAGHFELSVPGLHNVQNALAAIAVAKNVGVEQHALARGLSTFKGVKRRYQFIGEQAGIRVFDDYAHHPTEIAATLASVRLAHPRRLVVLFQPHRYTRTELLAPSFARSFHDADVVLLMPVYSAGEALRDGVTTDLIYQHMVQGHPYVLQIAGGQDHSRLLPLIASQLERGDYVMTVGAGDVNQVGQLLLEYLGRREAESR
ncbi:MAG: UDP-N-acetylmuramate--L-alanine ligase [Candidatus Riflebacteria bacterium]|nr:UDP-N-acetylmuramate--L-alanine ligase [Candidatus Riflebacteria bacterium]